MYFIECTLSNTLSLSNEFLNNRYINGEIEWQRCSLTIQGWPPNCVSSPPTILKLLAYTSPHSENLKIFFFLTSKYFRQVGKYFLVILVFVRIVHRQINEGLYTWGNMKILIIFAEANIPSFSSQQYRVG